MLTSTYTLVALSVEQTALRAALLALGGEVAALPEAITLASARAAQLVASLRAVYDNCHWRKLDKFLLPVLRRAGAGVDSLLRELEALSEEAAAAMAMAEASLAEAERVARDAFAGAVERCIAALRRRLEREETELFPLARSVIGGEAWFAIANQMLAHDAYAKERRGGARGTLGGTLGFDPLPADAGRLHPSLSIAH
jgi:hemerythrin-like domain-containing protein